jgi:hypothetical protein
VHGGSWVVIPPASPVQDVEGDLSWPTLATQINDWCGNWGPFPSDTLEVEQMVEVEERSSMGDLLRERSTCRSTMT